MNKLIWFVTAIAIAVWSLLAWAAHGLVGVAGSFAARHADVIPVSPELVELMSWLAGAGAGVGEFLIVALWAIVALALAGLGYAATRFSSHLPELLRR